LRGLFHIDLHLTSTTSVEMSTSEKRKSGDFKTPSKVKRKKSVGNENASPNLHRYFSKKGSEDPKTSSSSTLTSPVVVLKPLPAENIGEKKEKGKERANSGEPSGEIVFSGTLDFKAPKGKATDSIVWELSRLSTLKGIPVSLIASSSTSVHSIIVTKYGDAYAWGRGGQGQLGIGACPLQVSVPTIIEELRGRRIKYAATGANHSLVLTTEGDVYGFGANNLGQLGVGNYNPVVSSPTRMLSKKLFVKISCGADFSMIADSKGYLYSCGSAEHGRLGHGFPKEIIEGVTSTTFENENRARRLLRFFIKDPRTKLTKDIDDVKVVDVRCGAQHTIALDDRGRVFSWGFGGFGRLGHGSACDEVFPRLVNAFLGERRAAKKIWAGASSSLALSEAGSLLYWGIGRDSIVAPQFVEALRKKTIKSVACSNNSVMVTADEGLYTWSFGPTLGQMALGVGQKSSSEALKVPLPPNIGVVSISCGHSFTLGIVEEKAASLSDDAEDETDADKSLDAFPIVDLVELDSNAE